MQRLSELLDKIIKSKFSKNIAIVAGGTAFAQGLGIMFTPIITRIYSPDQYGILTVYGAALGLFAIVSSLDYHLAIPIADDDDKAINVLTLSILILILFVAVLALILMFQGEHVLNLLNSSELIKYKYLIPVGVLLTGIYNILLQWAFRKRSYKSIAKTKINQSISSNLIKIMLGLLKIGPIGLIIGTILGQSAGIKTLSSPIFEEKKIINKISRMNIKSMARRYLKFPIYSAPSNCVYTAGTQLPVIFLTTIFGSSVVGLFGLANSIVRLPMDLIGTSAAQVFYSEAANIGKSNPEKLKELSTRLIKKLALIGLIPLLVLLFFAPLLFSLIFGSNWYEAGLYAQIISVMVYFNFTILPVGRILQILERQREVLMLNVIRLLLIFLVFGVAKYLELTSFQTVFLYTVSNSTTYLMLLALTQKIMNNEINIIKDSVN